MKSFRYSNCKSVPSPFWLYVLEITEARGQNESPKNVSTEDKVIKDWENKKELYKKLVKKLKEEIKTLGETKYVLNTSWYRQNKSKIDYTESDLSKSNLVRTNKYFRDYKYNVCMVDGQDPEDICDIELFWELYDNKLWAD